MAEPPDPRPAAPVRLAAVVALLASLACFVSLALPWVHVDAREAARLAEAIDRDLPVESARRDVERDLLEVFRAAAQDGAVRPVDLVQYARTVRRLRAEADVGPRDTYGRALLLLLGVILAVPALALLVLFHLLRGGLRRFRAFFLACSVVAGIVGVVLPLGIAWLAPALAPHVVPGVGLWVLSIGAGLLVLSGVFGVQRRNWGLTYVLALLFLGAVGAAAWGIWSAGGPA